MRIVLASASPRRRELLSMIGLKFDVIPAESEAVPPAGASPDETVKFIAASKARDVAGKAGDALIIASDTLVYLDGEPMGKPRDKEDAFRMLRRLSGRSHTVYSGIAVIDGGREITAAESTEVRFRDMTDGEISAYIATGEPMDKAGAYGAQGYGSLFVEGISGDFFNVMGFPLCRFRTMMKSLGYDIISDTAKDEMI